MKVKVGDNVRILAGKDKGKEGRIIKTLKKDNKVVVEGVNIVSRHTRPSQTNQDGGIIKKEAPILACKVMLVDPKTGQPTRVGYQGEGKAKVRYAKKSGTVLDK